MKPPKEIRWGEILDDTPYEIVSHCSDADMYCNDCMTAILSYWIKKHYILLSEHEKELAEKDKTIANLQAPQGNRNLGKNKIYQLGFENGRKEIKKQLAEKDGQIKHLKDRLQYEYDEAMDELTTKDETIENLKVRFANDEAKWIHAVAERNKEIRRLKSKEVVK